VNAVRVLVSLESGGRGVNTKTILKKIWMDVRT
jgi:hypothetical protein